MVLSVSPECQGFTIQDVLYVRVGSVGGVNIQYSCVRVVLLLLPSELRVTKKKDNKESMKKHRLYYRYVRKTSESTENIKTETIENSSVDARDTSRRHKRQRCP